MWCPAVWHSCHTARRHSQKKKNAVIRIRDCENRKSYKDTVSQNSLIALNLASLSYFSLTITFVVNILKQNLK
jgi:hypothetical protein